MGKFKVGDKVKIHKPTSISEDWIDDMDKYDGQNLEIAFIRDYGNNIIAVSFKGLGYYFLIEWISLEPPNKTGNEFYTNNCPICGALGDDLVFDFYCTNKQCQNFHERF